MTATLDLGNLDPELYRHPGERGALDSLRRIPGFAKALEMLSDGAGGEAGRQAEIASTLRTGPGVYPVLADLWRETLACFGLGDIPLFVGFSQPRPWSLRGGNGRPVLLLSAEILECLPRHEMAALLAGQAGLVRLGNADAIGASDFLRRLADFSGVAGAPTAMLAWAVENWRRLAAFSSDRAASLALGGPEAVVDFLERISGGGLTGWGGVSDPERLRLQGLEARALDGDWSNGRWRRFAMAMNRRNHAGLVRRLDLLEWHASGAPARILSGEAAGRGAEADGEAAGADADPADETAIDPGLALWGEFAASEPPAGVSCGDACCPMAQVMGWAGKGFDSVWKAGEAFMKTLQDQARRDKR